MKKTWSFAIAALMTGSLLSGCSNSKPAETSASAASTAAQTTAETETTIEAFTTEAESETAESASDPSAPHAENSDVSIRVGSLKGPTSMGLAGLMDKSKNGEALGNYEFTMVTAADELLASVVGGNVDIALVPANVASILYQKTQSGISVIDINTLGVLNIVASDDSIKSAADLKGKTLYLTGKGTTPDYVIRYLLSASGLSDSDVTLEYKSEPTEVAAVLKEQPDAIGLLPQPFVTAACAQNDKLKIVLDLTKEWDALQGEGGSRLVTGVTVVRNEFMKENPDAVDTFLKEHEESAVFANEKSEDASKLIADMGIVAKAPIAQKAIPYCNIVCLTGEEMKSALNGYLQVLFEQNPKSVGGQLPDDGFYYIP